MKKTPNTPFRAFGIDTIKLKYVSVDGYRKSASFKTIQGALRFINRWVGLKGDASSYGNYIVSFDGVGKVVGVNVCMKDLLAINVFISI